MSLIVDVCVCVWRSGVRTVSMAAYATAWRLQIIHRVLFFFLLLLRSRASTPTTASCTWRMWFRIRVFVDDAHLLNTLMMLVVTSAALTSLWNPSSGCPAHLHSFPQICVRRKIGIWTLKLQAGRSICSQVDDWICDEYAIYARFLWLVFEN